MKRTIIFIAVVCAFVAVPTLADMMITVNDSPGVGSTNGGEFIATVIGDPILGHTGTFGTFCIETNEYLNLGGTYYVTLNSAAVLGGGGGPSPDPLSNESAWVYTQWDAGVYAHNTLNADLVQQAIWYFEGEAGGVNNSVAQAATAAVGDGWKNNSSVMVMNLYEDAGRTVLKQDLLVRVPLPGAVLLGFLGLGAAGIRLRKFV